MVEAKEMLDALRELNDAEYTIEVFKDFISGVKSRTYAQLINELNNLLYDFAFDENRCAKCNVALETHTWHEKHPYGSTYAEEECGELRCPVCKEVY